MAGHAVENNDVYVYTGGRAPQHITHARIDESVEVIEDRAFANCENLVYVETHNRIRKIGKYAFVSCKNLPRIDIKSVEEVGETAFGDCERLQFVEFGDNLETIGLSAFAYSDIEHLKLSVISVNTSAFDNCRKLIDVEFSDKLERVGSAAFNACDSVQRIAIPLKKGLFSGQFPAFDFCDQLTRVDLVGGVHQTISSLHMESWREEMDNEINTINLQLLEFIDDGLTVDNGKTRVIMNWIDSVSDRLDHYKTEHCNYVKEAAALLELALWKAKLTDREDSCEERATKKAKIDVDGERKERRVTSGADTVIKNVLPFLQLSE